MRLGQHFLKNKEQIEKIIDALELRAGDVVIELGAGHGELTLELARRPVEIIAIEKDRRLARALKLKIKNLKLKIIERDLLKELPKLTRNLQATTYKLVGNIPYYLTGYLFRTIGELKNKPSLIVFTVQKEVAERVTARPPKMNLLAASVQYWAAAEIIGRIPAGDFQPPPQVDSAIIRLFPRVPSFPSPLSSPSPMPPGGRLQRESRNVDPPLSRRMTKKALSFPRLTGESRINEEKKYYNFIKILFKQPRKTILNNLSGLKPKEELKKILKNLKIKETARPQNLDLEMIKSLARTLN